MSDRDGDWDIYLMDYDTRVDIQMTIDPPTDNTPFNVIDDRYPAWSPDGQLLAYHSNLYGSWDLFLMDENGVIRQLTNDTAHEAMPVWSPDGTRLAYHSTRDGNWDVYVITIETGEIQRVTFYAGEDTFAVWSPDGRQLVYVSDRDGENEIYVRQALTDAPPEALEGYSLRMLTDNNIDDFSPTWSPDGTQIAYVSDTLNGYEVIVMDAQEGMSSTTLPPIVLEGGFMTNEWNPAWVQTDSGTSLMFVSNLGGSEGIFMIDFARCTNSTETTTGMAGDNLLLCHYSAADRLTTGVTNAEGFTDSRWAPDWRPLP